MHWYLVLQLTVHGFFYTSVNTSEYQMRDYDNCMSQIGSVALRATQAVDVKVFCRRDV